MSKRNTTWSPKQRHIWQHNGFKGYASMMRMQAQSMLQASSLTDDARALAKTIHDTAYQLQDALKDRVDPWKDQTP